MVTQPEREQGPRLESQETKFWFLDHSIPLGHCSTLGKGQSREARHVLQLRGKGRGIGERLETHLLLSTMLGGRDRLLYHQCGDRTYQSWINSHKHSDEKARYHSGSIWLQSPYFFLLIWRNWHKLTITWWLSKNTPEFDQNWLSSRSLYKFWHSIGGCFSMWPWCWGTWPGKRQLSSHLFQKRKWQLWGQGSFGTPAPAAN